MSDDVRECAFIDCDETFEPQVWNHKYCSDDCKRAQKRARRRRDMVADIAAAISPMYDEDEEPDDEEVFEYLRRENKRLTNLVFKHKRHKAELVSAFYKAVREAVLDMQIPPVKAPSFSGGGNGDEEIANPVLSDWQLGKETVSYNSHVCRDRIELFADKVLKITEIHRSDHPVKRAHVHALGDIVEGEDIFAGQAFEIDSSLYRQVITGVEILSDFLRRMLSSFETVHFAGVIGNHGALSSRRSGDYNPETNMDRLLYKFVSMLFENEPRITFDIPEGAGESNFYTVDRMGGYGVLLMHGDQLSKPTSLHSYYKKVLGWKDTGIPEDFDDVLCFTSDTLILTKDGQMPINEVEVGMEVLTHAGQWKPVVDVQNRIADTVILKGQGHPGITTTNEHPFLSTVPVYASDNTWDYFEPFEWVEAQKMEGRFWASPCSFPVQDVPQIENHDPREISWEITPDLMRIVGRWVGDGHFKHNGMIISAHVDEAVQIKQEFTNAGIHHHSMRSAGSDNCEIHHINGKAFATWLKTHFGEYAHGKSVPTWLLGAPEDLRRAFLEGYIAADGHITSHHDGRHFEASTVSKRLAVGVKLIAQSLGYSTYLYLNDRGGKKQKFPNGNTSEVRDRWIVKGMAEFARYSQSRVIDDQLIGKVRSITDNGKQTVYNLTVADDSSYIADGLVVHNCGHWHQNTKATFGTVVLRIAGTPESDNTFAQEKIGVMGRPSQHLQYVEPNKGRVTAEYDIYLD